MKQRRRVLVAWYAGLSLLMLAIANAFPQVWQGTHAIDASPWLAAPFALLLLSIAVAPFIHRHWWEANYASVAITLGVGVAAIYVIFYGAGIRVAHTFAEFVSFISLIGSLFVVAGGIHIGVRGRATPEENVVVLAVAALLANVLGTTGASMIFIRPFIRMNRQRFEGYHAVFFIFLVSNIGGGLTPIGDPPLFLGYLKHIPFFWVADRAGIIWLLVMVLVLASFYAVDRWSFRRLPHRSQEAAHAPDETRVSGVHNIVFLFVIIAAVFIEYPAPRMLREVVMWGAAIASLVSTRGDVYHRNEFTFTPVREVAYLFAGIFLTMIPALDWLELHASSVGLATPGQFFWATGLLSSVLDNAPTYLNFLSTAFGLHGASIDNPAHMLAMLGSAAPEMLGLSNPLPGATLAISAASPQYVVAVSVAAVFFGAMTYIGNGPNFMVKSIVEASKLPAPSFFEYVWKYAVPVLLPVYALVWFLFFRA
ncbi:MAG: sodium:proton antiporter [Bacteroidetes bacterium]|nr:sodium:proton antiporter [Bacteroidota bacterium]